MKKKIAACAIALFSNLAALTAIAQTNIPVKSITITNNTLVPKNQTYYVYDSTGTRLFKVYKSGERVVLPDRLPVKIRSGDPGGGRGTKGCNCEPIVCPNAAPGCWKCY